jgi:hypothetical protein
MSSHKLGRAVALAALRDELSLTADRPLVGLRGRAAGAATAGWPCGLLAANRSLPLVCVVSIGDIPAKYCVLILFRAIKRHG